MALTMFEAFPSRDMTLGDKPAIDLVYIIMGTRDDDLVRLFLKANTPTAYSNLLRQSAQVKETAPETWECTVRYGPTKEPEKGDWKWDFDTTGGSQKITQSKENIHNYGLPGKAAPDFKGAIGVTDDSVEGCEIIVPQFKWTETHQLDAKEVTWTYSQKLFDLTGKTNEAAFRGFGVKQVLFYGAKGSQSAKNPDLVEMTFSFAASRDANGLVVGDINGIAKKAWEYLWVRYGLVPGHRVRARRREDRAEHHTHSPRSAQSGERVAVGGGRRQRPVLHPAGDLPVRQVLLRQPMVGGAHLWELLRIVVQFLVVEFLFEFVEQQLVIVEQFEFLVFVQ